MTAYHDSEWGVPVHDDRTHFEFLVLEAAQAGLSWAIVLKKREGYRRAFSEFDPAKVARYTPARIEKLTADPGIVRNRMKIQAAVQNARAFLAVQEAFGSFDAYCWRFVGGRPRVNRPKTGAGDPGHLTGVRRVQQGPEDARLRLRRLDDRVCPHAGRRHGERSPGPVLSLP